MLSAPNLGYLIHLLSDNGIIALENGEITMDDAIKMPISYLYYLIRDKNYISHQL